ncbi:sigma-70 family RNA polymerase sigma factor [Solirubrobacter ginsenosidimutans]|uniref:Sigma-70 family RNA polymerase sigma factor n=1 Tax=Solirubrobacter ginsenosidimutans TaxID=490573 RepID=A0A9X3MWB2_9ACTN|nr:sigma-70 family RNA polymerase sigma factor [Solirubrobacter ginsenosidimutans]MDA0163879.1 sigma-70 family RNA polymerase sigma factor [Solirubrobacter ginsenosidimutans]
MPHPDFSIVYDEHVWHVYGFFAYRLRSRADAEDLTQMTFERALRAYARYDASLASVQTWLIAIARNLLIDHVRSDRGAAQRAVDEVPESLLPAAEDRHRIGLDPVLERALTTLSDRERELIAMRFGGDLTGPEIAALTGLTLANVQQLLSRSLRRMRASMEAAHAAEVR